MKKLSGTRALLLLVLVALLAGNIYFGIGYFSDRGSKDEVADDIAAVDAQIAAFGQPYDIEELEAFLTNLLQQLADAPFPQAVEQNIIYDYVLAAVEEAGVAFDDWDAEGAVIEDTVNGTGLEYRLFPYEAAVSGNLDEIFDFLAEMEASAPYDTIKLDDVELTYDSSTLTWSMEFTILVYAQPE
jgi:hypothetical protein